MKIFCWNVNGVRGTHKADKLLSHFESGEYDFICLQETKAEFEQLPEELKNISGYFPVFSHSKKKKGYSGTAIYSKQKLLSVIYDFPPAIAKKFPMHEDQYGDPDNEGRLITAETEKFFLVTVYTPNSKGDLSRLKLRHTLWDPAFLEYMKLLEKTKPVIFCGDLNVAHTEDDLANPKQNDGEHGFTKEEREGIDKIIAAGFIDAFRLFKKGKGFYTWWAPYAKARERNVGWRIDYFFVSQELKSKVKGCEILPHIMGSDHCPVVLELK